MFAWLREMFGGQSNLGSRARGSASTAAPPRLPQSAQRRAAPREKVRDDKFWDGLRDERGGAVQLSPEDEELVVSLVCKVVDHVCAETTDPPAMPALAPRILGVVRRPDAEVADLVRVLEQDQAISAKLMSVANSAVFGPAKEITSLRDAILYMGTEQTAQIAIGLATRTLYDVDGRAELSMYRGRWSRLFSHGMTTAFAASTLIARKFRRQSDEAFLGGLFHDVGKAVALRSISALTLEGQWEPPSEPVMDEVMYRMHAVPGSEFYDRWTLPSQLMQICCDHHQLENAADAPVDFHAVCLVSAFDALRAGSAADKRYALDELKKSADALQLSDAELRAVHTEVRDFAGRVARMF